MADPQPQPAAGPGNPNPNPNPNPAPSPLTLGGLGGIVPLLPVFSGEAGGPRVTDFFDSLADVTKVAAWSKAQMLAVAKLKLTGIAREFVRKDRRIKEIDDFDEFKRIMIQRFALEPFSFRLSRFYTCVQKRGEDVQTYAARLQALATEIEVTVEPGANDAEVALIQRIQDKELDERLKAQFLSGIDIHIRQRTMSREPKTFDDALKAAISEETIEELTAQPRGIMRTVRENQSTTDSTTSRADMEQLTLTMEELKAKMDSLIKGSLPINVRSPTLNRNNRGGYNNPTYQRSEYRSNSHNRRYAQPINRTSERSTRPRNDFQNRGRWEGNIHSIRELRPQYYLKGNPTEENETRWKGRIGSTTTVLRPNPVILVYINNIPVKMQVDPRVERTLISNDLANRLKGKAYIKFGLRRKLGIVLGKPSTAIGTAIITLKLRGRKLCMPCAIVRAEVTTPCDGILGRDVIEGARLTLDFDNAQVILPNRKSIHFCTPLRPRRKKRRRKDRNQGEQNSSDILQSERLTPVARKRNRPKRSARRKTTTHRKFKRPRILRDNTDMTVERPRESPEQDPLTAAPQQIISTDPCDEFILNSIPPPLPEEQTEPKSESESGETEPESKVHESDMEEKQETTPPYALRSQGPVADQPWVMPRHTRSRIPRLISPASSRSSSP